MATYTPHGPFTNGGAPGLDASLFNSIETFLVAVNSAATDPLITSTSGALNLAPSGIVLNGSTSGTATLYQFTRGTWKYVLVKLNNFRNGGASNQDITLPTAFTLGFHFRIGAINGIAFVSSGTPLSVGVQTSMASGGGTAGGVTTINNWSIGESANGFDTLRFNGSNPTAASGIILIEGL